MSKALVPCHGCARHIRQTEPACPFCGIPRAPVATISHATTSERPLSRSAVFFAVSALAVGAGGGGVAACEKKPLDKPDVISLPAPPYGVAVVDDPQPIPAPTTIDAGTAETGVKK